MKGRGRDYATSASDRVVEARLLRVLVLRPNLKHVGASAHELGMAEQVLAHRPITLNFSGLKGTTGEPTSSWMTA